MKNAFFKVSLISVMTTVFAVLPISAGKAHPSDSESSSLKGSSPPTMPSPPTMSSPPTMPPLPSMCYIRVDGGYSYSEPPTADYAGLLNNIEIANGGFAEAGIGCNLISMFHADLVLGIRDNKDFKGELPTLAALNDPITTALQSYTLMANLYYDFDFLGSITPYVGAGLGLSYHSLDDVLCLSNMTNACALDLLQSGGDGFSFIWSLSAGIGLQVSKQMTFDIGYRYLDLGGVSLEQINPLLPINSFLTLDDLQYHEIKVGIRYHFGGGR